MTVKDIAEEIVSVASRIKEREINNEQDLDNDAKDVYILKNLVLGIEEWLYK